MTFCIYHVAASLVRTVLPPSVILNGAPQFCLIQTFSVARSEGSRGPLTNDTVSGSSDHAFSLKLPDAVCGRITSGFFTAPSLPALRDRSDLFRMTGGGDRCWESGKVAHVKKVTSPEHSQMDLRAAPAATRPDFRTVLYNASRLLF